MSASATNNGATSRGPIRDFLAGGGELGALLRAYPWDTTSLGPPETWPQSLKMAIRIMLTSRQPIWIGWGEELTYFYNDPYKSIIGGKHPWALGRPTREVWQRNLARDRADAGHRARRRSGDVRRIAAPDHGAQRLPGGDLLHLLLQPDPERRRDGRRNHLRQQRRYAAGDRRAPARAAAGPRGRRRPRPQLAARPASEARRRSASEPARPAVRDDLHRRARTRRARELVGASGIAPGHPAAPETIARRRRVALADRRRCCGRKSVRIVANLRRARRRGHSRRALAASADPGRAAFRFCRPAKPAAQAFLSSASIRSACSTTTIAASSASSPARSRRRSPTPRPMRRNAAAPRRWPRSTAPRRRSSPTSATNSARR